MLINYTGVYTPDTNEMVRSRVGGSVPGVVIRVRVVSGVKGEAAALSAILRSNGNTGGAGMEGLLD